MAIMQLVMGPDPIFRKKSAEVEVTDDTRKLMDDMLDTLHNENGIGMAATMVGVLKRVIVINLQENGQITKLTMANPVITAKSDKTQVFTEASLCFPGISAEVKRPENISVNYLDYNGNPQTLNATGFLATCIQHEIDYLDGKLFLDYLSPLKRDTLLRKMKKYVKGHVCSSGCAH